MLKYKVLSHFRDGDGHHDYGDTVTLSANDAVELFEIGVIEAIAAIAAPVDRQAEIVAAIGKLDKGNADLWLKDGKPDSSAIAAITGWPMTAAERDAAWEVVKATTAASPPAENAVSPAAEVAATGPAEEVAATGPAEEVAATGPAAEAS